MTRSKSASRPFWPWRLPFLNWIGELKNSDALKADLIAGISVALVLAPQSMAYAQLAGLPVHYGLYASFLPPMAAALFGSSRQLATGPVALVSLLTATALGPLAVGNPEGYLAYAMLLAFMVGVFQFLLGVLRLGVLVNFLSHPVVIGFTNAGALIIAGSQLSHLFGVGAETAVYHAEPLMRVLEAAWRDTHMPTLWMSLLSIGVMYGLKKHLPKIPNVLAAVALTTGLSYYTNFQAAGGHVVGDIPSGLPSFALPAFDGDIMLQLIAAAITISLLGFVETIAIAKKMAAQTRQRLDANQELIGQGLSNMVSGSFSAYPVSGSLSRSAINLKAGAVSGFSSVVSGIVIGAGLLWLTPLLHHLPQATLAAIVIMAAIDLIKIKAILHAWRAQPHDGVAALAAFVLTLALAPRLDQGLIIGVLLSIGLFLYRSMRPRMAVLSRYHDGALRDISVHHLPTSEKIAVLRFDDSLHFANAGYFEAKVLDVAAINPELRFILIDANGIAEIDATGEDALFHLVQRLKANGVELLLARMNEQCMGALRRTQASDKIGEDHFFSHVEHALSFAWDQLGTDYDRESCPLRHPHQ